MDKRELKIDYFVCRNSVPAGYEELSEKALAAAGKAYCIYSGFAVGAAVLLENGTIVLGNNQENVAYPITCRQAPWNVCRTDGFILCWCCLSGRSGQGIGYYSLF